MSYLQFTVLGFGLSAIYALLAIGIVVVYRGSGVLNFAHGALAMVAGYTYYELTHNGGWPFIPALLAAMAMTAVIGALIHLGIMRRLKRASALTRVIATLAVLTSLEGIATLRYSGVTLIISESLPQRLMYIDNLAFPESQLWLLGIAIVVGVVLWMAGRYTRIGLATVAMAENELATSTLGWSPDVVATATWTVGAALAGLAGVLVAPVTGLQVTNLPLLVIPAMAAALVGGFTSLPLTVIGAVVLGSVQSILTDKITATGWPQAVPLLVIVVVLIVRGRALPLRSHVLERLPNIGTGRIRPQLVVAPVALVCILCVTWFGAEVNSVVTATFTAALIILSVVVLTGYAGQISLAQMAFGGVGALIAGRLVAADHWPFEPAIVVGVLGSIFAGVVFALPALRTRGVNLAVVTLSLGLAVQDVVLQSSSYTGGANGTIVGRQHFFGINVDPIGHPERYAILSAIIFTLAACGVANIRRGRSGHRMISVRANERAAASLGINVVSTKLYAFVVSAALAGLGGILLAFSVYILQFSQFSPLASINTVIYAVVGGIGWVFGPLFGSTLASGGLGSLMTMHLGLPFAWLQIAGGVGTIFILIQNPNGMVYQHLKMAGDLRKSRFCRAVTGRIAKRRASAEPSEVSGRRESSRVHAPDPASANRGGRAEGSLELRGVSVRFGIVEALTGVDLTIRTGEVVGLIGPNGAGKTTLIDAATGFVRLAAGEVLINGMRIDRKRPHQRARSGLGRSFQSLELFVDLSVLDNLHVASDAHDTRSYFTDWVYPQRASLTPSAEAAINDFGLHDILDRSVEELTFSQRRLVAIARAVATEPSVLMLDEPAAGLDTVEVSELSHLLRQLADERHLGILLVEHDMTVVMNTCDRIATLDFGRKIAEGTPEEVRSDPVVIAAYLGGFEADDQKTTRAQASADVGAYRGQGR